MKHGLNNNLKRILILICGVAFIFCTGDMFYTPELINADQPFIVISGSISNATKSAELSYQEEHTTPTPTPTKAPTVSPTKTPTPTPVVKTEATVRVSDGVIYLDGKVIENAQSLEETVRSPKYDDVSFTVEDDYAEASAYKIVIDILQRAGKKISEVRID